LWLALSHADPSVVEEARNAILNLTKSKRNFLNSPPEDIGFTFDYPTSMPQALAAVNADPKLNMARFYLVPTYIKEEEFWRNWFYRVQIILTAYGLEMPKNKLENSPSLDTAFSSSLPTDPHSPILSAEDALSRKIEKELGELGIHASESNPEAWEEELKRELSSLDPSKEAPDSLLSQNWEEELMLELGLKNSPGLPKETNDTKKMLPSPTHLSTTPSNTLVQHSELRNHPTESSGLSETAPSIEADTLSSTTSQRDSAEHPQPTNDIETTINDSLSTDPTPITSTTLDSTPVADESLTNP